MLLHPHQRRKVVMLMMKCLVTPATNPLNLNQNLSPAISPLSLLSPAMDQRIRNTEAMRCLVILAMVLQSLPRRNINLILIKLTLDPHHLIRHSLMDSRVDITLLSKDISHSSMDISHSSRDISHSKVINHKDTSNSSKDISHKDISQNSKGISLHNKDISNRSRDTNLKDISLNSKGFSLYNLDISHLIKDISSSKSIFNKDILSNINQIPMLSSSNNILISSRQWVK